jgi:hypothetical protein
MQTLALLPVQIKKSLVRFFNLPGVGLGRVSHRLPPIRSDQRLAIWLVGKLAKYRSGVQVPTQCKNLHCSPRTKKSANV